MPLHQRPLILSAHTHTHTHTHTLTHTHTATIVRSMPTDRLLCLVQLIAPSPLQARELRAPAAATERKKEQRKLAGTHGPSTHHP